MGRKKQVCKNAENVPTNQEDLQDLVEKDAAADNQAGASTKEGSVQSDFVRKYMTEGWKIPQGEIKLIRGDGYKESSDINMEAIPPGFLSTPRGAFFSIRFGITSQRKPPMQWKLSVPQEP